MNVLGHKSVGMQISIRLLRQVVKLNSGPDLRPPLVWTRKPPTVRFCESVVSDNVFMTAIRILLAYLSR